MCASTSFRYVASQAAFSYSPKASAMCTQSSHLPVVESGSPSTRRSQKFCDRSAARYSRAKSSIERTGTMLPNTGSWPASRFFDMAASSCCTSSKLIALGSTPSTRVRADERPKRIRTQKSIRRESAAESPNRSANRVRRVPYSTISSRLQSSVFSGTR